MLFNASVETPVQAAQVYGYVACKKDAALLGKDGYAVKSNNQAWCQMLLMLPGVAFKIQAVISES